MNLRNIQICVSYLIAFLLGSVYCYYVWVYNTSFPVQDDMNLAISFIKNLSESESIVEYIGQFFHVTKGQTAILYRILIWFEYFFDGNMDYEILIWMGHFIYFILIGFIAYDNRHLGAFSLLPVFLLSLVPIARGINYFAIIGIYPPYFLLVYLIFRVLLKNKNLSLLKITIYLCVSFIAVLSFGAGIVFLAAIWYILWSRGYLKKLNLWTILWIVLSGFIVYTIISNLGGNSIKGGASLQDSLLKIIKYPFAFSGSFIFRNFDFKNQESIQNGLLLGLVFIIPILVLLGLKIIRRRHFDLNELFFLLLLASSGIIAVARVPVSGLVNSTAIRYEIMAQLILVFGYLVLVSSFKPKTWLIIIVTLLSAYVYWHRLDYHLQYQSRFYQVTAGVIADYYLGDYESMRIETKKGNVGGLLNKAQKEGLIDIPGEEHLCKLLKSNKNLEIKSIPGIDSLRTNISPCPENNIIVFDYKENNNIGFIEMGILKDYELDQLIISGIKSVQCISHIDLEHESKVVSYTRQNGIKNRLKFSNERQGYRVLFKSLSKDSYKRIYLERNTEENCLTEIRR